MWLSTRFNITWFVSHESWRTLIQTSVVNYNKLVENTKWLSLVRQIINNTAADIIKGLIITNQNVDKSYNTYSCLSVSISWTVCRVAVVKQQPINAWTTVKPLRLVTNINGYTTMLGLRHWPKWTHGVRVLSRTSFQTHYAELIENCSRSIKLKWTTKRCCYLKCPVNPIINITILFVIGSMDCQPLIWMMALDRVDKNIVTTNACQLKV